MAGLTTTGFSIKALPDIVADINAQELALISPSLDVQPTAILGVINGIFAAALYEVWQLAGALYNGMNPDAATGDQLASLALLTGDARLPATATVVTGCVVNVNAGFSALAGTMVAQVVGNPSVQFESLQDVTNATGAAATRIVDFIATTTGPVQALSGTLTVIAQALSGWNSITNPADGITGKSIETDALLRARRQAEIAAPGSDTAAAIRADVLASNALISQCIVLYNSTGATDANGVPGHSFEVIAYQPGFTSADNTALANVIFANKAAGDGTSGTTTVIIADPQGNSVPVSFTRPTVVPIYVALTVVTDPTLFPVDGVAQIKAALASFAGATYREGVPVYAKHLQSAAFNVPGVLDIPVFTLGTAPSPMGTGNIPITIRQLASLSTGNVAVTVT